MKNLIIIVLLLAIASTIGVYLAHKDSKIFIVKNNNNRDIEYEHYCDSIWIVNPEYYNDVLVESDEFQNYIDEHGQWWDN